MANIGTDEQLQVERRRKKSMTIGLIIVGVLMIVAALVTWYIKDAKNEQTTVQIQQIKAIATLATAEAHLNVIIEEEDYKLFGQEVWDIIPGTKRTLLLVVPTTVLAGIDLEQMNDNDLEVDETQKHITIQLPKATIVQEPSLQMDQVKAYSEEGLFRGQVDWQEGFELTAQAQQLSKDEAVEAGLLEAAEQKAETVFTNFYRNLGYSVDVKFN